MLVVTAGVVLTTLSAVTPRKPPTNAGVNTSSLSAPVAPTDIRLYMTGISILFVALLLSSLLGIVQDLTYTAYRKRVADQPKEPNTSSNHAETEPWQESMFYLHFLSMPMFLSMRQQLMTQFQTLLVSPSLYITLPSNIVDLGVPGISQISTFASSRLPVSFLPTPASPSSPYTLAIPSALAILVLNTITQLVCVSGVHRLTSRVSSLTVTLVLVVRKAVSLLISVFLFEDRYERMDLRSRVMMLGGAALVFAGTFVYSLVPKQGQEKKKND